MITMGRIRCVGGAKGFTLIEIMVVVVIVAALFTFTIPSLSGVNENNRLRASVRELTNLMKYARTEAVFNARTTQVFLDTEQHEYWLDLRNPADNRRNSDKLKTTMERRRELEKNVAFEAVNAVEKNILKSGTIAIDFYPDGTASPTLISLRNIKGETRYTLEVLKSTGLIEISKADLETVAEQQAMRHPLPDNYYENMMPGTGTW